MHRSHSGRWASFPDTPSSMKILSQPASRSRCCWSVVFLGADSKYSDEVLLRLSRPVIYRVLEAKP
jgi:hypothetical protein